MKSRRDRPEAEGGCWVTGLTGRAACCAETQWIVAWLFLCACPRGRVGGGGEGWGASTAVGRMWHAVYTAVFCLSMCDEANNGGVQASAGLQRLLQPVHVQPVAIKPPGSACHCLHASARANTQSHSAHYCMDHRRREEDAQSKRSSEHYHLYTGKPSTTLLLQARSPAPLPRPAALRLHARPHGARMGK